MSAKFPRGGANPFSAIRLIMSLLLPLISAGYGSVVNKCFKYFLIKRNSQIYLILKMLILRAFFFIVIYLMSVYCRNLTCFNR